MFVIVILDPSNQWSDFINSAIIQVFIEMPAYRITPIQPCGLRTVGDLAAALATSIARKGWFVWIACHALAAIC